MAPTGRGERVRERRGTLTREEIATTAVALADQDGLPAVSMRRVAERVGVEAMSLYHHVTDKEGLLDAMADQVVAEIPVPAPGPWREVLHHRAHALHATLARHPWAVAVLESRPSPGATTLEQHDALLRVLHGDGLPWSTVVTAMSTVDAYVYGFAVQQAALPFSGPAQAAELATTMLDQVPAETYPGFTEFLREHVLGSGYDHTAEFDRGLTAALAGLALLSADGA